MVTHSNGNLFLLQSHTVQSHVTQGIEMRNLQTEMNEVIMVMLLFRVEVEYVPRSLKRFLPLVVLTL